MKILDLSSICVSIFLLSVPFLGKGQTQDRNNFKITPLSPNTASLGLYGHTPVGHYTGIPAIDIPLYEIDLDGKKIPISLSYHASGIRVAQESSSVGLGWSLNLGGCITKTVNGEDDFVSTNNAFKSFYFDNLNLTGLKSDLHTMTKPQINDKYWQYLNYAKGEPDMYYYNFAGFSGKMFFDKVGTTYKGGTNTNASAKAVLLSPKKTIEVVYNMPGGWAVKDLDGYTYGFEATESTISFSQLVSGRLGLNDKDLRELIKNSRGPEVTAYYLTYIESPAKNRVTFQYEQEQIYSPVSLSEQNYYTSDPDLLRFYRGTNPSQEIYLSRNYYDVTYSYNRITQLRPTGVVFNGGTIQINAAPRTDLLGVPNETAPKRITSLQVKDTSGKLVKSFDFEQSYRGTPGSSDIDYLYARLMLDKITENTGAIHSFSYNKRDLPAKNSFETDFWGYYNQGQIEGNPKAFETIPTVSGEGIHYGRDKRPKAELMTNMMLTQIKYPTGGSSNFFFEPHRLDQQFSYLLKRIESQWVNAAIMGRDYNNPCDVIGTTGKDVSSEFQIDKATGSVKLEFRVNGNTDNPTRCGTMTSFSVWIEKLEGDKYVPLKAFNGTNLVYDFSVGHTQLNYEKSYNDAILSLSPGKYRIRLRIGVPGYTNFSAFGGIAYEKTSVETETFVHGAGLRIQKIIDSIGAQTQTRRFDYSKPMLMYRPSFSTDQIVAPGYYPVSSLPGYQFPDFNSVPSSRYTYASTSSIVPFSNAAQGNIVGYSKVTERLGEGDELGYTEYVFENDPSRVLGAGADRFIPFFPTLENFMNGSPRSVTKYNNSNQIVQKDTFNYKTNTIKNVSALKVYVPRPLDAIDGAFFGFYDLKVEETVLENKSMTTYINGAPAQVIKEDYLYDPTYSLITSMVRTDSQGKVKKQLTKYPFDYTDAISLGMMNKYLKAIPIEQLSLVDNKVVSAQKISYKDTLGMYLPARSFSFSSTVPQALNTYASYYKNDYIYSKYNAKGKLLEFFGPDMLPTSYLWDNLSLYPLAIVRNARHTDVLTAFANYDFSGTGNVNSSKEILIRNSLGNSFVTTYTYFPLVGMTSKTDPRGVTEYYKYDSKQRLQAILDHLNHVTKAFDYHYRSN
ncbi:MAG: hypothetical protein LBF27_06825 [Sphingobacterium sp.]|jgi:hypothetical protein|nr:hypothetical protein [Sphingobacterium sp.]